MHPTTNNEKKETIPEAVDFETAINATGFGIFNWILFLVSIAACFGSCFATTTTSYILPSAECDLKLNLVDKGVLNAITYAGMITGAFFWGFVADTQGRKVVLVIGSLLDATCALCSALSPNLTTLMVFKYFGGFFACGSQAVLMSYMTEVHGARYRPKTFMMVGTLTSSGSVILPALAWIILPNEWNYEFFNGLIVIRTWKIFLAICSLPSLIFGLAFLFFPESPKFYMSRGRNDDALKSLRKMYAMNYRKPEDSYPIKKLLEEVPQKNKADVFTIGSANVHPTLASLNPLRKNLNHLKPMFSKMYLGKSVLIYTTQFCALLGLNTIRLWLPQIFNSIEEFNNYHLKEGSSNNFCVIIEYSVNKTKIINQAPSECEVILSPKTYLNSVIVGCVGLVGYFVAGTLINALGHKRMSILSFVISGVSGFAIYWANSSTITVITSALYTTVGSVATTSLLGVAANVFPTSLRAMIISLSMMFGRCGALIGNILFPYFMSFGCLPPIIMIAGVMFIAAVLSLTLPTVTKSPLK